MRENNTPNSLQHHGIMGMRWGVRRYQNKDGSLTPAGKKRAAKLKDEYTDLTGKRLIRKSTAKTNNTTDQNKKKSIRDMSDDEIKNKINRLENEKRLAGLQADTASKGEKFVSTVGKQVIAPAAIDAGKRLLTDVFMKIGKEKLGLNNNHVDAADEVLKELRKENETLNLKKNIHQNKKTLERYAREEAEAKKQSEEAKSQKAEKVKAEFVKDKKESKTSNSSKEDIIIDAEYEEVGESIVDRYKNLRLPAVRK